MTALDIQRIIQSTLEKMDNATSEKIKRQAEEIVLKIYEQEIPLKDALNITHENEATLYKYGYQLFQSGKYRDAMGCFFFLKDLRPTYLPYTFALAATYQYMQNYTLAANHYIECIGISPDNPAPYFHLYDCFLKLNQPMSALHAIASTIAIAKEKPEYQELLTRAQLEYNRLVEELKKPSNQPNPPENKGENV